MSVGLAWQQVKLLFHAADRHSAINPPLSIGREHQTTRGQVLIEASNVGFSYKDQPEPVLRNLNLTIRSGDRVLLEGASGSGKSTFASLIAGLHSPHSGLILMHGLDFQSLGEQSWRQCIASAPQFHENHVLTGTLAFNLLMGKRWPPRQEDFDEAEHVCRQLGLSELLERMPSGLLQMVGETGWQLSHGERSRLFMARALLQHADLVVLDESFAALDPETMRQCLVYVRNQARTLLVIAHP